MSSRKKLISLAPRKPDKKPLPTLREFWEALQRSRAEAGSVPAGSGSGLFASSGGLFGSFPGSGAAFGSGWAYGSGAAFGSGFARGSGMRSGSGSGMCFGSDGGCGGYGVGLILSDPESQKRIMAIMRALREGNGAQHE